MEDGLWTMRSALADALDQISSPRSSSGDRTGAFEALEKQLVVAHSGGRDEGNKVLEHFLALQYTFECNVALRMLPWIAGATEKLEALRESTDDKRHPEMLALGVQLEQALTLLQGVAFSHEATKAYLGRLYPVQLLVDLLNTSRYVPSARKGDESNSQALTASVLATLSSILIDSPPAMRSFEEAGGPQAAIRVFKRSNTSRNVRLKILEFLYLYVMGEEPREGDKPAGSPLSESPATSPRKQTPPPTAPVTPIRPSKRYIGLGPAPRNRPSSTCASSTYGSSEWQSPSPSLSAKSPVTSSSRSSSGGSTESGTSTGSNVSNSTAATSVASSPITEKASAPKLAILTKDILTRDTREKGRLSPKKRGSATPSEFPSTPNGSTGSGGMTRTVPSTPTSSRASSRHLLQTPASSRASSRGDLAPEARRERSFRFPPPMQPRLVVTPTEAEPITPLKSRSSRFSPPPQTPVKSPIGLGRPAIRHAKSKSMSNVLSETQTSESESKKAKRLGSAATVPNIPESPKELAVPIPQRSATHQGQAEKWYGVTKDGVRIRSPEEKKKILAAVLGSSSIETMIEGMTKAGVQGFV